MKTSKSKKSLFNNVRYFSTSIVRNYARPISPPPYVYDPNHTRDQKEQGFERTYFKKLPPELEGKNYKDMPSRFVKGDIEMTETQIKGVLSKNPSLLTINHPDSLNKDDLAYLLVRFHDKHLNIGWYTKEFYKDAYLNYHYLNNKLGQDFVMKPFRNENGNPILNSTPNNFKYPENWEGNWQLREVYGVFTDKSVGPNPRNNSNSIRHDPEFIMETLEKNFDDISFSVDYVYASGSGDIIDIILQILKKFI